MNIVTLFPRFRNDYRIYLLIMIGLLSLNLFLFLRRNNYMEIYKTYRNKGFTASSFLVIVYIAITFFSFLDFTLEFIES